MKFRRDTEARDPADALDLIRAELLRVVPDLADAERRCDAHLDDTDLATPDNQLPASSGGVAKS